MNSRPFPLTLAFILLGASAMAEEIPRPEHPEPLMVRDHWLNLNGTWEFRFDPKDQGKAEGWSRPDGPGFDRKIVVPFGWESELSGIKAADYRGIGWYRRTFQVPETFPKGQRVWLHFGAVDWEADVWVNGKEVAHHEGGYTPFSADITDALEPGKPAVVAVRAFDPTDPELPTGKQVGWYTPTSGIWQTVWLESRPEVHIRRFSVAADRNLASARIVAEVAGDGEGKSTLEITSADPSVKARAEQSPAGSVAAVVDVRDPKPWSPESPHLYEIKATLKGPGGTVDTVSTYFALRTVAQGKYGDSPIPRILLNGKPVYLRGALDQSFNPEGIYTAPSDEFLRKDIELAKSVGLNMLRIHIKPEEPRRLYWADKLGILIMEDMANTWKQSPRARAAWEGSMREVIARDANHPSIFAWVAFNETWGLGSPDQYKASRDTQDWVAHMVGTIQKLDPTRIVEDHSPCNYDHIERTDLKSWHFYIDNYEEGHRHIEDVVARSEPGSPFNMCPGMGQPDVPLINSEYGGIASNSGDRDVSWSFRHLTTQLRRHEKIQGYVYTELTDIEWEHNGFADYDRKPKDFGYGAFLPGMTPADLQGADFVGYDGPPAVEVKPGDIHRIPVFVSHYSGLVGPANLRWTLRLEGTEAKGQGTGPANTRPVEWKPYGVTELGDVEVQIPQSSQAAVGSLNLELLDEKGERIAANYQNIVVRPASPAPLAERADDRAFRFRFRPDDYADRTWTKPKQGDGKAQGTGTGHFSYEFRIPAEVVQAGPERIAIGLEASARADHERVDWAERNHPQDNPQTDADKWPSELAISINGVEVARQALADDPADGRGVLSHLRDRDHGSYGEWLRIGGDEGIPIPDAAREQLAQGRPLVIRLAVPDDAKHRGGLAVFGERTGQYPLDPVVTLRTKSPLPEGFKPDPAASLAANSLRSRSRAVLATGESAEPTSWRYTTDDPGAGWERSDFDDSGWKSGKAGFGSRGTPGIRIATPWSTPSIWLRTEVEISDPAKALDPTLRVYHDEDVEVFINGTRIFRADGYVTGYRDVALDGEALKALKPGKNVVAVRCRQSAGGQGVDVGLSWVEPPSRP